jgi:hypothetical protein
MSKRNARAAKQARRQAREAQRPAPPLRFGYGFYLIHACGHRITWVFDDALHPPEIPGDAFWQPWVSAYEGQPCPWCNGSGVPGRDWLSFWSPRTPERFAWQGWSRTHADIPGAIIPNAPPPEAEL